MKTVLCLLILMLAQPLSATSFPPPWSPAGCLGIPCGGPISLTTNLGVVGTSDPIPALSHVPLVAQPAWLDIGFISPYFTRTATSIYAQLSMRTTGTGFALSPLLTGYFVDSTGHDVAPPRSPYRAGYQYDLSADANGSTLFATLVWNMDPELFIQLDPSIIHGAHFEFGLPHGGNVNNPNHYITETLLATGSTMRPPPPKPIPTPEPSTLSMLLLSLAALPVIRRIPA